jgi:hypothetical protein
MVTDEEIVEIIDQAEAGVGDLLDAYESIETAYFASVRQTSGTTIQYAVGTTTAP